MSEPMLVPAAFIPEGYKPVACRVVEEYRTPSGSYVERVFIRHSGDTWEFCGEREIRPASTA